MLWKMDEVFSTALKVITKKENKFVAFLKAIKRLLFHESPEKSFDTFEIK